MTYREVDFNVVMDACYHWLKDYELYKTKIEKEYEDRKFWRTIRCPNQTYPSMKDQQFARVKQLLTLAKCPGAMNRIVYLTYEDAYILFGDI